MTYLLMNHGDGGCGVNYGIRADHIGGTCTTFSAGSTAASSTLELTFDPLNLAGGATITGTVSPNAGGAAVAVNYALTGLSANGLLGFNATGGSGTLGATPFTGKANGSGFVFIFAFDGHRCPGGSPSGSGNCAATDPIGRGWLMFGAATNGTNDFLVRATLKPVPLPPAILLLLGALAGLLGISRIRRRSAAVAS